jgi:hypothetical protein
MRDRAHPEVETFELRGGGTYTQRLGPYVEGANNPKSNFVPTGD